MARKVLTSSIGVFARFASSDRQGAVSFFFFFFASGVCLYPPVSLPLIYAKHADPSTRGSASGELREGPAGVRRVQAGGSATVSRTQQRPLPARGTSCSTMNMMIHLKFDPMDNNLQFVSWRGLTKKFTEKMRRSGCFVAHSFTRVADKRTCGERSTLLGQRRGACERF